VAPSTIGGLHQQLSRRLKRFRYCYAIAIDSDVGEQWCSDTPSTNGTEREAKQKIASMAGFVRSIHRFGILDRGIVQWWMPSEPRVDFVFVVQSSENRQARRLDIRLVVMLVWI
jgi:hypothetical protein